MNVILMLSHGKNVIYSLESTGDIVQKENESEKKKICSDITSFDAVCISDDRTEIFATTFRGSLINISITGETVRERTLMETKDADRKICSVRCLYIEGRYHVFYCLKSRQYLIHQVVSDDEVFEPKVIDTVSKRFAYDITKDLLGDIYIVYSTDNEIRYRKYIYSKKSIGSSAVVCHGDPRKIQCTLWGEKLFVAYSEQGSEVFGLNLATPYNSLVKKGIFSLDKDSQFSVNAADKGIVLHIAEKGVCYKLNSDEMLNVSRPVSVGKTPGIWQVRSYNEKYSVDAYPITRFMLPFESIRNFEAKDSPKPEKPMPVGYEAESFARKYTDMFEKKVLELERDNILQSLSKIEASLNNLTTMVKKLTTL